jgi:transcriptional regulator with GAF, ATPase, and Fis domain
MTSSRTRLDSAQGSAHTPEPILIGNSREMREVEQDIRICAGEDITVLITGESGAGKELVAQSIHRNSKRSKGPLMVINCGSLTESLLESKLFGHVKGAFTGAAGNQSGLFEAANGGTIFLDEIGDMPMSLQGYLLRVLQERTVVPIGAQTERKVDVRVIAATNKDLPREVREGRFRQDLYYRLNEFPIRVPSLREHPSDISLLVRHFLAPMNIEEEALTLLCGHQWPGNVRELKATVKRLALRASTAGVIAADQVRRELGRREESKSEGPTSPENSHKRPDTITYTIELRKGEPLDTHFSKQKLAVYKDLLRSTGSHLKTAEWLGLDPKDLHHRKRRWERQVNLPPRPNNS